MPEILTESFCERCGTRYTFESASPKGARLKGLKVVSRGLRNFVMSDDTSIDEAMAAARNETDREVTSQQLDAFHKAFNFCMTCRQYTCSNCWNEVEGRCLSCAPNLGQDVLPSPFPNVATAATAFERFEVAVDGGNGHADEPAGAAAAGAAPMAWPTSDLMREEEQAAISFEAMLAEHEAAQAEVAAADVAESDEEAFDPLARLEALQSGEPDVPAALGSEPVAPLPVEPVAASPVEPVTPPLEPVWPSEPAVLETEPLVAPPPVISPVPVPFPEPEPIAASASEPETTAPEQTPSPRPAPQFDHLAAAAAVQTTDLFNRFRPGQDMDEAIAAYERTQAAADALATAEPLDATQAAPTQPEVERLAPAPEPTPVTSDVEPEPLVAAAPPPFRLPTPDTDRAAATARPVPERFEEPAYAPEPAPVEPREDLVPQPTWQIVAPDTAEPEWPAQPQWPEQPEWPKAGSADGLAFLGRPAEPTGGIDALWAESSREVAAAATVATPPAIGASRPSGGVQPCISCGLSLSANARFCRRCGSRQG